MDITIWFPSVGWILSIFMFISAFIFFQSRTRVFVIVLSVIAYSFTGFLIVQIVSERYFPKIIAGNIVEKETISETEGEPVPEAEE